MRKYHLFLAALLASVALWLLPASGLASPNTVDDQAGLLNSEQIQQLNTQAEEIEKKAKASVFFVTNDESNEDSESFSDNYLLDKIGKDANGIIFFLNMNTREFYISRSGNMIDYLDDERVDTILDNVTPYIKEGSYYNVAETFLANVSSYFDKGVPKGHYRIDRETGKITYYKTLTPVEIGIAVIAAAGLSILFIVLSISKYQLKFGSYKYPMHEKSSLKLTGKEDRLTNSFVTQRRIPKNNGGGGGGGRSGGSTTHTTGGGTFSGSGRSF